MSDHPCSPAAQGLTYGHNEPPGAAGGEEVNKLDMLEAFAQAEAEIARAGLCRLGPNGVQPAE